MTALLLMHWLLWLTWLPDKSGSINQVSRTNQARQNADLAYRAGQYGRALSLYKHINDVSNTPDPVVKLDLGHTYFQLRQYSKAAQQYNELQQSGLPRLRTVATTQLGVIACIRRDSSAALNLFKEALLIDYTNEPARHNFELVNKRYSPATSKIRPTTTQASLARKSVAAAGRVERSTRQDELLRRFRQLNLTEEQALQLLNAMQHDDLPYALTQSARKLPTKQTKEQQDENGW